LVMTVAAVANPKITISTSYYSVDGDSAAELRSSMRKNGPGRFHALTKWRSNWDEKCRVNLSLEYVYPKWENRAKAPKKLRQKWDKMLKAMRVHEEIHGEHFKKASREVVAANCVGARRIFRKWERVSRQYDNETRHGATQGVILR